MSVTAAGGGLLVVLVEAREIGQVENLERRAGRHEALRGLSAARLNEPLRRLPASPRILMLAMIFLRTLWNAGTRHDNGSGRREFQPLTLHFPFNRIPDQRGDVGAAEGLDLADAGGGGDVDLGEVGADHVDAGEEEPAPLQLRSQPRADLAVARR